MNMIYCVEDDTNIRELVVYALKANGFEARGFEDAKSFYETLKKERPSLCLLDIMLPGEDGLSILKYLREHTATKTIPVIMLTAKSTEYDKVVGLDGGADDYIAKPFGVMELLARIRSVLRRANPEPVTPDGHYSIGPVTLDTPRHTVTVHDKTVTLTLKEFDLLHYLMQNKGIVLSRDKIMTAVWGFDFEGESRTVDMHIKTLRQKLGEGGALIETIRGVGYRIGE